MIQHNAHYVQLLAGPLPPTDPLSAVSQRHSPHLTTSSGTKRQPSPGPAFSSCHHALHTPHLMATSTTIPHPAPIGCRMPHLDGAVLAGTEDDRQLRVEGDRTDVVGVALQGVDAGLGLVVPHLQHHTAALPQQVT